MDSFNHDLLLLDLLHVPIHTAPVPTTVRQNITVRLCESISCLARVRCASHPAVSLHCSITRGGTFLQSVVVAGLGTEGEELQETLEDVVRHVARRISAHDLMLRVFGRCREAIAEDAGRDACAVREWFHEAFEVLRGWVPQGHLSPADVAVLGRLREVLGFVREDVALLAEYEVTALEERAEAAAQTVFHAYQLLTLVAEDHLKYLMLEVEKRQTQRGVGRKGNGIKGWFRRLAGYVESLGLITDWWGGFLRREKQLGEERPWGVDVVVLLATRSPEDQEYGLDGTDQSKAVIKPPPWHYYVENKQNWQLYGIGIPERHRVLRAMNHPLWQGRWMHHAAHGFRRTTHPQMQILTWYLKGEKIPASKYIGSYTEKCWCCHRVLKSLGWNVLDHDTTLDPGWTVPEWLRKSRHWSCKLVGETMEMVVSRKVEGLFAGLMFVDGVLREEGSQSSGVSAETEEDAGFSQDELLAYYDDIRPLGALV
jgi:hypothetical protein